MTVSSGIIRYELLEAADSQLSFVVSASEIKNIRLPSGEKHAKFGIELNNGLYYKLSAVDSHDRLISADPIIEAIQQAIPELRR